MRYHLRHFPISGGYRSRTDDPLRARQVLWPTELIPHLVSGPCGNRTRHTGVTGRRYSRLTNGPIRAKDRVRTGDPDLGKVMLYQLSYFRTKKDGVLFSRHIVPTRIVCLPIRSSGRGIRTPDLKVMSLASYLCSTPRY